MKMAEVESHLRSCISPQKLQVAIFSPVISAKTGTNYWDLELGNEL